MLTPHRAVLWSALCLTLLAPLGCDSASESKSDAPVTTATVDDGTSDPQPSSAGSATDTPTTDAPTTDAPTTDVPTMEEPPGDATSEESTSVAEVPDASETETVTAPEIFDSGASASESSMSSDVNSDDPCADPMLQWGSANKTNYESYPDPGSEECIEFNGCEWEGQFAACNDKKPEAWVAEHNIVAAFPNFEELALHDLCLRSGDHTMIVTVLDTCGDSDCDGCCTENRGDADLLIDLESYTNERWAEPDGRIEWADLGPTQGDGCD